MALPSIKRELIELTPKMAADLLAKNEGNRGLSDRRVRQLAAAITRGAWEFNGQTIVVDDHGNLLDGQHRCAAVVLAKRSVQTIIVYGVPRRAFATIDSGRSRTAGDMLTADGRVQGNRLAAALRLAWQDALGVLGSGIAAHIPTNADIEDADKDFGREIDESVRWINKSRHVRQAAIAFLHWKTMRANPVDATKFWDGVLTGVGLERSAPALRLRDLLFSNHAAKSKLAGVDVLDFAIRAWVNFLANHNVESLKGNILGSGALVNAKGEVEIPMTRAAAEKIAYPAKKSKARHAARAS